MAQLPAMSWTPELFAKSSRNVPLPLMPLTGTVYVVRSALADSEPIVPVAVPVVVSVKSPPPTL